MELGQSEFFLWAFQTEASPSVSLWNQSLRAVNRQIPTQVAEVHLRNPTWARIQAWAERKPSDGIRGPDSSSHWALLHPSPSYGLVMCPNTFLLDLTWIPVPYNQKKKKMLTNIKYWAMWWMVSSKAVLPKNTHVLHRTSSSHGLFGVCYTGL